MKRLTWILLAVGLIAIGWLTYNRFELIGMVRGLTTIVHDQEIRIQGAEKQIPNVVRYTSLVRIITEKAQEKLTAFEITEIARIILVRCQENADIGLTPDIILGLIERESAFNPQAPSTARAYGLTQCLEGTFSRHLPGLGYQIFSEELAYNPIVNCQVGIAEMVRLRRYFLSYGIEGWGIALTAYFWGERNTWELLESKKRAMLPSLEYGQGILNLASKYREQGIT